MSLSTLFLAPTTSTAPSSGPEPRTTKCSFIAPGRYPSASTHPSAEPLVGPPTPFAEAGPRCGRRGTTLGVPVSGAGTTWQARPSTSATSSVLQR